MVKYIVINTASQSFDTIDDAMTALRENGRISIPHFIVKADIVSVVSPTIEVRPGSESQWRDVEAEKRAALNAKQAKYGTFAQIGDVETDSAGPSPVARTLRY